MAWNQPTSDSTASHNEPKSSPSMARGIIAGAVVAVLAAVCVFVFMYKGEKPVVDKAEKKSTKIKAVAPAAAPKNRTEKAVEVVKDKKIEVEKYPGEKIISSVTNSSGYIMDLTIDASGKKRKHVYEKPSIWKTPTDELLAVALLTPEGQDLPPWPNMRPEMDKDFIRALETPIEELPTDDENVIAMKRVMISAREEIKNRLENGEHFCDILTEHRELANENGKIRADAVCEYSRILREGDEEGARKYLNVMNAAFSQMGIRDISPEEGLPKPRRSILERIKKK